MPFLQQPQIVHDIPAGSLIAHAFTVGRIAQKDALGFLQLNVLKGKNPKGNMTGEGSLVDMLFREGNSLRIQIGSGDVTNAIRIAFRKHLIPDFPALGSGKKGEGFHRKGTVSAGSHVTLPECRFNENGACAAARIV